MAGNNSKSWVRRGVELAVRNAFLKAYDTIKVDPENYLQHLRMAYDLPALTYDGVYSVDPDLLDHIAEQTIRAHMRMAAAEGAGLGMGGLFTMLPDLGILAAITLRMIQKLSLLYGFAYDTEQEEAELWIAAAMRPAWTSAASWWRSSLSAVSCRASSSASQSAPAPRLWRSGRRASFRWSAA